MQLSNLHSLVKFNNGKVIARPAWFLDVRKQGEAIADVSTHLVDLEMWTLFADQGIDYRRDIKVLNATRSPIVLTLPQFQRLTNLERWPSVVGIVMAAGEELYRSPVLHEGLRGIPLDINLRGVHQFSIRLESVGEKPPTYQVEWDQADWANARLTLTNGRVEPFSELPIGPLPQADSTDAPFSFELDGKSSSTFLTAWQVQRSQHRLNSERTEYDFSYTDSSTGLVVRGVAIVYDDFPCVEWTLYFKNQSTAISGILSNIEPLDTGFERGNELNIALHHSKGSMSKATDFQPLTDMVPPGGRSYFSSVGGRPTDGDMPYFNLAWLSSRYHSCARLAGAMEFRYQPRAGAVGARKRRPEYHALSAHAG